MRSRFVFPFLLAITAAGQVSSSREVRFEVLSIHPLNSTAPSRTNFQPSPNGFDSALTLWQAIMVAYGPADYLNWRSVEVLKAPGWIGDFYDVKGRVPQADLAAWQKQGREHERLRSAMRAALKERCKLVIHEQPSRGEVFALVVGKNGPRLKTAAPDSLPASGEKLAVKLKNDGIMLQTQDHGNQVKTFYGATMQDLTDFLNIMSGGIPVREHTGLTGRYDFTIQQTPPSPDENQVYSYAVGHLGLQVKQGTESRPVLVIDHIEKPTAN